MIPNFEIYLLAQYIMQVYVIGVYIASSLKALLFAYQFLTIFQRFVIQVYLYQW